jgi:hypothetical protein
MNNPASAEVLCSSPSRESTMNAQSTFNFCSNLEEANITIVDEDLLFQNDPEIRL